MGLSGLWIGPGLGCLFLLDVTVSVEGADKSFLHFSQPLLMSSLPFWYWDSCRSVST
jgi:hypothetical protein